MALMTLEKLMGLLTTSVVMRITIQSNLLVSQLEAHTTIHAYTVRPGSEQMNPVMCACQFQDMGLGQNVPNRGRVLFSPPNLIIGSREIEQYCSGLLELWGKTPGLASDEQIAAIRFETAPERGVIKLAHENVYLFMQYRSLATLLDVESEKQGSLMKEMTLLMAHRILEYIAEQWKSIHRANQQLGRLLGSET